MFAETYGVEKDKSMNIISLILLDQLAMKEYLTKQRLDKKNKRLAKDAKKEASNIKSRLGLMVNEDEEMSLASGTQSQSRMNESMSSNSHSSRTNGTSETSVLKQMYSSTEKTASQSLKLITQLILLVFVLLLILSTINLALSLKRYE